MIGRTQRYASPRAQKSYDYRTDIAVLGIGITVLLCLFLWPRDAVSWGLRGYGDIYAKQGKVAEALACYKNASTMPTVAPEMLKEAQTKASALENTAK